RTRHRTEGQFRGSEEAIAMAVMYTANHLKVRAIVALTESGATPLWMSRIRSDVPIYAFTRHEPTRRRVTIYRGVYPVIFDVTSSTSTGALYGALFSRLLELDLVKRKDLVILTRVSCRACRVARTPCRSCRWPSTPAIGGVRKQISERPRPPWAAAGIRARGLAAQIAWSDLRQWASLERFAPTGESWPRRWRGL